MPNVHLTEQMEDYIQGQIKSGSYTNLDEVVCAGMRLLMDRDNARQFYALKAGLEEALREAEAGGLMYSIPKLVRVRAWVRRVLGGTEDKPNIGIIVEIEVG